MLPRIGGDGDKRAGGRSEADGKDPDSSGGGFLGGSNSTGFQLLSIGHQDKCPAASLPPAEGLHRHTDG